MENLITIIVALLGAAPIAVLYDAYKKKYAEEKNMKPKDPDAVIGFAKHVSKRFAIWLLTFCVSASSLFWLFTADERNRALCDEWLKSISPGAGALARFLPEVLIFLMSLILSLGLFGLIEFLVSGTNKAVKRATRMTRTGLLIGLFIGGFSVIAAELFCASVGNAAFFGELIKFFVSNIGAMGFIAVFFASIIFYAYEITCAIRGIPKMLKTLRKTQGKHYK